MWVSVIEKEHIVSCNHSHSGDIKMYWWIAGVTFLTLAVEIGGSWYSGSLALLSDAIHVLFDFGGITIALLVEYYVRRKNFGDKERNLIRSRGGIISSCLLFISVAAVCYAAIKKVLMPQAIDSTVMSLSAIVGLGGNWLSLGLLHGKENDHITNATLHAHISSDLWSSAVVVGVGCLIFLTDFRMLDPICSFLLALWLLHISLTAFRKSWKSMSA